MPNCLYAAPSPNTVPKQDGTPAPMGSSRGTSDAAMKYLSCTRLQRLAQLVRGCFPTVWTTLRWSTQEVGMRSGGDDDQEEKGLWDAMLVYLTLRFAYTGTQDSLFILTPIPSHFLRRKD